MVPRWSVRGWSGAVVVLSGVSAETSAHAGAVGEASVGRKTIADLRDYLAAAAGDFPGAVRVDVVEDETGMFSVELESGEELFVAIASVIA
jgi:hypothetical protein